MRDKSRVLRYAPRRVRCPACGPRVEHLPWANRWQRVTRAPTTLRVSTGALEALNNNVKAISHRAHGYRTVDTYITASGMAWETYPWSRCNHTLGRRAKIGY
jgi:transposase